MGRILFKAGLALILCSGCDTSSSAKPDYHNLIGTYGKEVPDGVVVKRIIPVFPQANKSETTQESVSQAVSGDQKPSSSISESIPASNSNSKPKVELGINASLGGKRPFPDDSPWNTDISKASVDPNSASIIRRIGGHKSLRADFGSGLWEGAPIGIPYVVVDGKQTPVPIMFTEYGHESDPGPYPIPGNSHIEGHPKTDGDRHVIVIDRDNWKLYELFHAFPRYDGLVWNAGSGAIYDLSKNHHRRAGWTSADAAGLPIFPGLVRGDEVFEQKEIKHALRFTVNNSRRAYVHPARHWASHHDDPLLPPMGMRVRLKSSVDISGFAPEVQVILKALKKYGMILADNGSDWFMSGCPDERWNNHHLQQLKRIKGSDFEVIEMKEIITPYSR